MRESTSLFDVNAAFSLGQSPARVLLSRQWVKSFRADDTVILARPDVRGRMAHGQKKPLASTVIRWGAAVHDPGE
jgi:hypothetical protein